MILGIDTSCYTTSVALMNQESRLTCDMRRLLAVEKGARGLRQSDAVYAHTQNLPQLLAELFCQHPAQQLTAIAVSAKPRPVDNSFMPVFTSGYGVARILAAALQIPLLSFSHQEGHLAAALWSAGLGWQEPFLALHLSGGTGEILQVEPCCNPVPSPLPHEYAPALYRIGIIGDTDLPPGQFVDRIGVALGMDFPAGAQLDALATTATRRDFRLSGSVTRTHISFSGPESAAQRAIASGVEPSQIAAAVFDNIGKSLAKAIRKAREISGIKKVLLMGGVAASQNLRRYLEQEGVNFASAKYSSDNAAGTAAMGVNIINNKLLR